MTRVSPSMVLQNETAQGVSAWTRLTGCHETEVLTKLCVESLATHGDAFGNEIDIEDVKRRFLRDRDLSQWDWYCTHDHNVPGGDCGLYIAVIDPATRKLYPSLVQALEKRIISRQRDQPKTLQREQHGGKHYKGMGIQPAEYNQRNKDQYGWCEGEAIKLLSRHRRKNGSKDLIKAIHYIKIALEIDYGVEYDPEEG